MLDDGDNGDDGFDDDDDDDDVVDDVVDDVDDLRCFYIHRRPHTHTRSYIQKLTHRKLFFQTDVFTHKHTKTFTHTHTGAFTQVLLCTETFTQIGFHTHTAYHSVHHSGFCM